MGAHASEAAQLLADAVESARSAGLHHVSDEQPGIRRVPTRSPRRFRYVDPDENEVEDEATLARIDALRIPPAWTDVWICRDPRGHIQATGRDARTRKQYRYHERWRDVRDATKFEKILDFARALPAIRARVTTDLGRRELSRERVLATAVRLLDTTAIRVGNEEYTRENHSYGLTTLTRRHVRLRGDEIAFHFRGKSGKERFVSVRDPRVARVVRTCVELPGQVLLKYRAEDGSLHAIHSHDVNAYLREAAGDDFTAKDFRTWSATVLAGLALRRICSGDAPPRSVDKQVVAAIKAVAEVLGNTPSVCRKCYVHPLVLEAHVDGALLASIERSLARAKDPPGHGLRPEEAAVLTFLRRRLHVDGTVRARPKKQARELRSAARAPAPRSPRTRAPRPSDREARRLARGAGPRSTRAHSVDR
ncbi:DNA topoisomerase IB [Sandaracinus amylolyticus]|uniref:DNA topoisomerase IB n=1 Tax=Sandaracinus amylolyticus TaxID=927083 RepID=UPI001F1CDA19|nr:DNA topoisomerase IB [Sandaracinus amylolyticus]UJR80002.1 putative type IB DNA topoisomerase [Sandaracinus amylolyticus]